MYLKLYLSGLKIGMNAFIPKGSCQGEGDYTWSDISVNEKVGLSAGGLYVGRGEKRFNVVCSYIRVSCSKVYRAASK